MTKTSSKHETVVCHCHKTQAENATTHKVKVH